MTTYCENCGKPLTKEAAFCPECGRRVRIHKASGGGEAPRDHGKQNGQKRARRMKTAICVLLISSFALAAGATGLKVYSHFKKTAEPTETKREDAAGFLHPELLDKDRNNVKDCIENDDRVTDTDGDGLTDFEELTRTGTDPTAADTDGNGVADPDDDEDGDSLTNTFELNAGTSPTSADTDGDGLADAHELNETKTDPLTPDSDGDGASDGWETKNGFDPLAAQERFGVTADAQGDRVTVTAAVSAPGGTASSLKIRRLRSDALINSTIPGYIDAAFEISAANDDIGIAEISFTFDAALLEDPDFVPAIYCFNEDTGGWYRYETEVSENKATAITAHFSKYMLMNQTIYERYVQTEQQLDAEKLDGPDSNNDGISDYLTKLMCDGVIRLQSGALVFGPHTYEEVQANNDLDGDGIINGDEAVIAKQTKRVPEDAAELNGHYYKIYDSGSTWDTAQTFCLSLGGHLATITSAEEQELVKTLVFAGGKNSYWLGARGGNREFSWITGEEWTCDYGYYNNNDKSGYEDCLMMFRLNNPMAGRERAGMWNDLHHDAVCGDEPFFGIDDFGLVCEWEAQDVSGRIATLHSCPYEPDTDGDGFDDKLDPTPYSADVFKTMEDYKRYFYDGELTVTICTRQPVWNSRECYNFNEGTKDPYFTYKESGHTFLMIHNENNEGVYVGFYPGQSSDWLLFGDVVAGTYKKESGDFTVAETFVLTEEQLDLLSEYYDQHDGHDYKLTSYNCTTFAVNAVKHTGTEVKIREHHWFHTLDTAVFFMNLIPTATDSIAEDLLVRINDFYYGYSPADATQDIRENYDEYVVCRKFKLTDGSEVDAYEVFYDAN